MADFRAVAEGDLVHRLLAETVEMKLLVTRVDDSLIYCGFENPEQAWTFDRVTGVEVDHDLRWGPTYGITGSRLTGYVRQQSIDYDRLRADPRFVAP